VDLATDVTSLVLLAFATLKVINYTGVIISE
jgi:hypothetical protein